MNEEAAKALRAPFDPAAIGKLPRVTCRACSDSRTKVCVDHSKQECPVCGNYMTVRHIHLDYVGHAAVTDRLLEVDPEWSWEPVAIGADGAPLVQVGGSEAKLWIRLTIAGTTRYGVGIAKAESFELEKQLIGDAIRNAAMRFGVALDLWSKEDLHRDEPTPELPPAEPTASKHDVELLQACVEELEPDQRTEFLTWKAEQNFSWPWTVASYNQLEAKLEEIVGAGVPEEQGELGTAAAPAPTDSVGAGSSPPSEATDTHDMADVVSDPAPTLIDDPERPF